MPLGRWIRVIVFRSNTLHKTELLYWNLAKSRTPDAGDRLARRASPAFCLVKSLASSYEAEETAQTWAS